MNGRLIAAQTGADIQVIEHFGLLHDVKRYDESRDIDHGGRAADLQKRSWAIGYTWIKPKL